MLERNRLPIAEAEGDVAWWVGTPALVAERMRERIALGFRTFMAEVPAPYDPETIERWIGEVRPMLEAG